MNNIETFIALCSAGEAPVENKNCQSKISNLEVTIPLYQEICTLDVTVQNALTVATVESIEHLLHITLDLIPVIKLTQNDDLSCHEPNTFEVRVVILVQHQPCSGSRVRCKGFLDLLSFDYAFRPPTSPDSDSPIRFWIQQLKSEQKLEVLVQSF
ncbi:hypothetical protein V6N12_049364 [Hibiscus sabdariffa]|uniref:Uncharacterized protein n=1 Tax=Hibiscus sabdariffa TaxID=183260 RepID=A0ABR2CBI4_9ROSI